MHEPNLKIALLGWESLLWDRRPEFGQHHGPWLPEDPELPMEFSRVSSSRKGALTLVIDNANGALCRSAYALSSRRKPDDAISDLRCREETVKRHMGCYYRDSTRRGQRAVPDSIPPWVDLHGIDVVVWTGPPRSFEKEVGRPSFVKIDIRHL